MESTVTANRPVNLVVTTALMAFSVVALLIAAVVLWAKLTAPLTGSILLIGSSTLLLWFYWQGHPVARWIVLLLGIFNIVDALYALFRIPLLAPLSGEPDFTLGKAKYVFQICVCIYIVGWLLTRKAATYFSSTAFRERKSVLHAGMQR